MKKYKIPYYILITPGLIVSMFYYTLVTISGIGKEFLGDIYGTLMTFASYLNAFFKANILGYTYKPGACAPAFLIVNIASIKTSPNYDPIRKLRTVAGLILGIILFFLQAVYVDSLNDYIKLLMVAAVLALFCYACLSIKRFYSKNLLKYFFNDETSQFIQQTQKIENPYSVNLGTEFIYNRRKRKGWLNIVDPFRATALFGMPGSGKSYSIVLEFIRQFTEKGFSLLIYDFKYPTLTEYAYNAFCHYNNQGARTFQVINFDNLKKSHRCNPISPALIDTMADARQVASVLIENTKQSTSNSGDFFTKKAQTLLTASIWFFKNYSNGAYCTLPHVIEFMLSDYKKVLQVLQTNQDVKPVADEFANTLTSSPAQASGEIATLTSCLEQLRDKNAYWVLTGDDFTLDINNPDDPKILCIGNNPARKDAYSPVLALYTSKIMELTNQQGKIPCGIIIDELPTMKFKDLDSFVGTCRSNKIATLLCAQNKGQYDAIYGKTKAESLPDCCNNQITGAVAGETADIFTRLIGTRKNIKESFSTNKNKYNEGKNTSVSMEQILPTHKIAAMDTGQFAGKVVDDKGSPSKGIFFGKIITEPLEETHNMPDFYPELNEETINRHFDTIQIAINDLIQSHTEEKKETVEDFLQPIKN